MDDELLESLLYDDEGTSLDFKLEQYAFERASREEKSELLKDIFAMANARRTGPGHILIGVEERRGERSRVVGESDHPGEHTFQEFVDSKANRPVEFSYRVYDFEGEKVGIFRIPVQRRPFFVEDDYGKLKKWDVWVRRGSATVKADPDEVFRMGQEWAGGLGRPPSLQLEWADLEAREHLGTDVSAEQVRLDPKPDPETLKPRRRTRGPFDFQMDPLRSLENPSYYEELIDFVYRDKWLTPLGFWLKHAEGPAAKSVKLVVEIERSEELTILDRSDRPREPSRYSGLSALAGVAARRPDLPDVDVAEHPSHWTVTVPFGDVAPQQEVWSTTSLYVGATESTSLGFTARLYAENLPEPTEVEMGLSLDVETRPMEPDDVKPHLDLK